MVLEQTMQFRPVVLSAFLNRENHLTIVIAKPAYHAKIKLAQFEQPHHFQTT